MSEEKAGRAIKEGKLSKNVCILRMEAT